MLALEEERISIGVSQPIGRSRFDQLASNRLDGGLSPGRDPELDPGVVDVKVDRAFAQSQNLGDFGRGLAARDPCQGFNLAMVQIYLLDPDVGSRNVGEACVDDRHQNVEIDGLGDVIVRTKLPPLQFVSSIGKGGEENERHVIESRRDLREVL